MGTNRVELTLFPEYSTLVSAERNLEEYPLFELKARQRGSKARLLSPCRSSGRESRAAVLQG